MAGLSIPQMIANTAAAGGVPPGLAVQVAQQESSFNPSAMGSKGELGLFQLMPSTAAALGVTDPLDAVQNAQGGVSYLSQLYAQFGSWDAALAAYNWGPTNVQNAMAKAGSGWLSLAPASTQMYVANALAASGVSAAAPAQPAAAAPVSDQATQDLIDAGLLPDLTQSSMVAVGAAPATSSLLVWILIGAGIFFGAQILFGES